ncbi:hypothetical protein BDZ97DRAFT_1826758 [Flammula alnicola]|nr:hypothetical protein BDZ97DRAFT_1826758 [Flammula alnicola]
MGLRSCVLGFEIHVIAIQRRVVFAGSRWGHPPAVRVFWVAYFPCLPFLLFATRPFHARLQPTASDVPRADHTNTIHTRVSVLSWGVGIAAISEYWMYSETRRTVLFYRVVHLRLATRWDWILATRAIGLKDPPLHVFFCVSSTFYPHLALRGLLAFVLSRSSSPTYDI